MPELNADFCYKLSVTNIDFQRFWYEKKLMYLQSVATFVYIKRRANTKWTSIDFKNLCYLRQPMSQIHTRLYLNKLLYKQKYLGTNIASTVFSGQNPLLGSHDSTRTLLVFSLFNWEK